MLGSQDSAYYIVGLKKIFVENEVDKGLKIKQVSLRDQDVHYGPASMT